jgi:hypothetical protein
MAQKVQVILVDDVDGGQADETVNFALDGVNYEIDLSASRARELRKDLEPWVSKARKVGSRGSRSGRVSDVSAIRAWAKANGVPVSERGRVSAEGRQAYAARKA